jgi:uncharacterized membrane protein
MSPQPEIRIGDAEREAAVTALGEHYAAGRLTKEEYDERAAIAWTAKTNSALWPLFADLPRPQAGPPPRAVSAPPRRHPDHRGHWLGAVMMPFFVVLVVIAIAKHIPLLVLVGIFWLLWAKTSSQARRNARRREWENRWGRG